LLVRSRSCDEGLAIERPSRIELRPYSRSWTHSQPRTPTPNFLLNCVLSSGQAAVWTNAADPVRRRSARP